jgi:hypothetical protein
MMQISNTQPTLELGSLNAISFQVSQFNSAIFQLLTLSNFERYNRFLTHSCLYDSHHSSLLENSV